MPMHEPKPTIEELGNQHGYMCPECKKGDSLYISAIVTAALSPEGADTNDSDTEWNEQSPAWCGCGWGSSLNDRSKHVCDLLKVELADELADASCERCGMFDRIPGSKYCCAECMAAAESDQK